ncbi:polyphosphate kinase 2 [Aureitalea marina]|uniref:ADP/GDP-polyphosphate phosphotransferase n=1 Tax=Aureitalea marina TaxID=930804 RepID=A0A2S7KSJ2_9FLAO|nr:polyphosphate kinase 2 [Aureitalea marina]PQB05548.1 polyphosphate kinase 2 [Aureitalea marina]
MLTIEDFKKAGDSEEFFQILQEKEPPERVDKILQKVQYEEDLIKLQAELVNLQQWVEKKKMRVAVIFEGRDAAGKGGAIRRFTQHLNPRSMRVVALNKPTEVERGQWYFRRYIKQLPNPGEIVFFDRSWYNRAVVEPVNGFCSEKEYDTFMNQVIYFERMIIESGIRLIKLYFSISKEEQAARFEEIIHSPVKRWKYSKVDQNALGLWDEYTRYKERMFEHTNTLQAPWLIIQANRKTKARVEAMEHILNLIPYKPKDKEVLAHQEIEY